MRISVYIYQCFSIYVVGLYLVKFYFKGICKKKNLFLLYVFLGYGLKI